MKRYRALTCRLALLATAVAAGKVCAEPSVQLKIETREVYAKEAFSVTIEISNFSECDAPTFPDIPDCTVLSRGVVSNYEWQQRIGRHATKRRMRTYEFELTPEQPGELIIPPIPVPVDGSVLTTLELKLEVLPSNADELFGVTIATGRERIFVGQRVPATLTIWIKPARYGHKRYAPDAMLRLAHAVDFGPFPMQYNRQETRQRPGYESKGSYYAYDYVTDFVAERPGALQFEGIEVGIRYPAASRIRSIRARAVVEPTEVLPVPMEGRPATFSGAVGLYDIRTTARPTDVRVGDPIELVMEVFGRGPIETLPPPLLNAQEQLNARFRVPDETLAGEVVAGRRRFTVTIRARNDDVTEIPSLEYPYFDPDVERFVIARSAPIPITVSPAAEVSAPDLTPVGMPETGGSPSAPQALDGLHDIETDETELLATVRPPDTRRVVAAMFGPPVAFGLVWAGVALVQQHGADPARRRRANASRRARRRIAQARGRPPQEWAVAVATTMAGYLADRLDEPPARFTGHSAADYLRERGLRPNLVERWASVIARCDEASYAGSEHTDVEGLSRDALDCLAALERERL